MNTFKTASPQTGITVHFPETTEMSETLAMSALTSAKPPDTIFCMGDMILMGVMRAIHKLNLKVPDEIAIVSISNGLIPTLYNPVITYVETSGFKLGKLAFTQMLARLKDEVIHEIVCTDSMLVKGGSL